MEKQFLLCFLMSVIVKIGQSSNCRSQFFKIYSPDVILEYSSEFDAQTSYNVHSLIHCASLCTASEKCKMLALRNAECSITRKLILGDPVLNTNYYPVVDCPEDFIFDDKANLCYKVIEKSVNYTEAALHCKNMNAEVLRVDSSHKQTYIKPILNDALSHLTSSIIFIQGEYNPTTDVYYFDNGDAMVYTNWNTAMGQPEKQVNELYIAMRKNHDYRWHDFRDFNLCDVFVCEKRAMTEYCT